MRFANPLIVVSDINKSKKFYHDVLDLDVILDFGANVTLTGGVCLQTKQSWIKFIGKQKNEIRFGGNDAELYFEEDDFDGFIAKLSKMENIQYVHDVIEHDWGIGLCDFMTQTGILSKSERICLSSPAAF